MTETTTIALSELEIDAVIRALENSGCNSGDFKVMVQFFNDPQLAKAGKAVLGRLRASAQRRTRRERVSGSTDVQRELIKPDVLDELRSQMTKANADARFAEERLLELRQAIRLALDHLYDGRHTEATQELQTVMRRVNDGSASGS